MSRFPTTRWSVVLSARSGSRLALAELLRNYWQALYAFARRSGATAADAQDATQSYFLRFIEKDFIASVDADRGRFRSFLLASFKHHAANEREHRAARKRGGDRLHLSLDFAAADALYKTEDTAALSAEQLYDRRWALTVMGRAMERLEEDETQAGNQRRFAHLKPFLTGDDEGVTYEQQGRKLGLEVSAMKVAVHRLRKRYGEYLRAEVAETAADDADVDDELKTLLGAVSQSSNSR
jgi:RNA polymerase sigma-70 factor (ECF subfamily)